MPPKTTDFAIVYAPTEGLYAELASFRDPKTKELLMEELRTKYKITVAGPNTLCAILQAFHMGFHTLKVQKHATQIHDDLKNITNRFTKHFDGILVQRKKLEEEQKKLEEKPKIEQTTEQVYNELSDNFKEIFDRNIKTKSNRSKLGMDGRMGKWEDDVQSASKFTDKTPYHDIEQRGATDVLDQDLVVREDIFKEIEKTEEKQKKLMVEDDDIDWENFDMTDDNENPAEKLSYRIRQEEEGFKFGGNIISIL